MSYEGRIQLLCEQGHYHEIDCYLGEPSRCQCGAAWKVKNNVDDTNGEAGGYIEPTLLTEKKCTHCESVLAQTFKLEKEVTPKERIEVGDTVRRCSLLECIVKGCTGRESILTLRHEEGEDSCICCTDSSDLTLIHKGSKRHVFEGIFWREKNVEEADCHNNQSACIPHVPCERAPLMGLRELCDNGKTYYMELTEEAG